MTKSIKDFGSSVARRASKTLQNFIRRVEMSGDAKIDDHQVRILIVCSKDEVLGFHVTVDYVMVVLEKPVGRSVSHSSLSVSSSWFQTECCLPLAESRSSAPEFSTSD